MKTGEKEKSGAFSGLRKRFSPPHGTCLLIWLITSVLIWVILFVSAVPKRYAIPDPSQTEDSVIAEETIYATRDGVDEERTRASEEAARASARNRYADQFHIDPGSAAAYVGEVSEVMARLRQAQQFGASINAMAAEGETVEYKAEQIARGRELAGLDLTDEQVIALFRMSDETFDTSASAIRATLTTLIQGDGLSFDSQEKAIRLVNVELSVNTQIDPVLLSILESADCIRTVTANYWVQDTAYIEAKEDEAAAAVPDVTYRQGQVIVTKGTAIEYNQYKILENLGLLAGAFDVTVYIGVTLLTLVSMISLYVLLRLLHRSILDDVKRTLVLCLCMLLGVGLCAVASKLINVYTSPVMLPVILICTLLGARAGLGATVAMSVIIAGMAGSDGATSTGQMISVLLMTLLCGTVTISFLKTHTQRVRLILCCLMNAVVASVALLIVTLLTSVNYADVWTNMLYAAAGAVAASLIALGIQPVIEGIFNLATSGKLLELSNPNHPLLRKLLLEAPGTYHHSIIVANLAEAAAESIGANPLLARTGAYFHDVGKLKRPQFFKENQNGVNLLNDMDPHVAATIVTSHTRDGVELAQKYRLPPEIQRIIAEHHGDTPVMYFYNKAMEQAGDRKVDIGSFRYAGPRPSSKEAAIVMLADTAEAAVRTISNPTPQAIHERIEKLVQGKIDDGQLRDCPLTMKELNEIVDAFARVLNGAFHERIEYPTTEIPKRGAFGGEDAPVQEDPQAEPVPAAPPVPAQTAPAVAASPAPATAVPEDIPVFGQENAHQVKPSKPSVFAAAPGADPVGPGEGKHPGGIWSDLPMDPLTEEKRSE